LAPAQVKAVASETLNFLGDPKSAIVDANDNASDDGAEAPRSADKAQQEDR
jgi:hypothetical protein